MPNISLRNRRPRRFIAMCLTLVLLSTLLPLNQLQARQSYSGTGSTGTLSKLSPALQAGIQDSYQSCVWSDQSRKTVRVLIQTFSPISSSLLTAIVSAGGTVVRQFTSINGLLAELPKSSVLTIAARSDVERMTADHLAQKSASHLEVATGADRVRTLN